RGVRGGGAGLLGSLGLPDARRAVIAEPRALAESERTGTRHVHHAGSAAVDLLVELATALQVRTLGGAPVAVWVRNSCGSNCCRVELLPSAVPRRSSSSLGE